MKLKTKTKLIVGNITISIFLSCVIIFVVTSILIGLKIISTDIVLYPIAFLGLISIVINIIIDDDPPTLHSS